MLADPIPLHQALLNLVVNAIEAMESEPPERERTLAVNVEASGFQVRIRVADTGRGPSFTILLPGEVPCSPQTA